MNLISFAEPITLAFKKSAGGVTQTFEANRPYLIASNQMDRIMRDGNVQARTFKISIPDNRIRNFHVANLKPNERVLLFNGSGGYGDQIMTWPVAKILADRGAQVHILTDPGNNVCWWNLDFVRTVSTIPLLWEQVKMFDHFIVFETVINRDEHQDQYHPVDMMLDKIGIPAESVPAEQKCVRPRFTASELGTLNRFLQMQKPIGMYQMSSANPVRALPVNDSIFMAVKIAQAHPDTHWLCLYDEFNLPEYKEKTRRGNQETRTDEHRAVLLAQPARAMGADGECVGCGDS
jgi:hypothetical protein